MLVIVLVLVLVAFALLVLALLNSAMLWAWLSVLASLVAAVLLTVDWWRRRRAARAADGLDDPDEDEPVPAGLGAPRAVEPAGAGPGAGGDLDEFGADANGDADAEPDEEQTDAADVLAVSESDAEVRVVDERPRYHLASCGWLAGRSTLGLPVREARELGFTPCARCTPDRRLAAAQRRASAT